MSIFVEEIRMNVKTMIKKLFSLHFGDCHRIHSNLDQENGNLRKTHELLKQENLRLMGEIHTLRLAYDYQMTVLETKIAELEGVSPEEKLKDLKTHAPVVMQKRSPKKKRGRPKKSERKE